MKGHEYDWQVRAVGRPDRMETETIESRVRAGVARSQSDGEIARAIGVTPRTVFRVRHRLGLPNIYGVVKR